MILSVRCPLWDTQLIPITAFQMDVVGLEDGEEKERDREKKYTGLLIAI